MPTSSTNLGHISGTYPQGSPRKVNAYRKQFVNYFSKGPASKYFIWRTYTLSLCHNY